MKITFDLTDEKTITNDTVKLAVLVTGAVAEQSRDVLETAADAITKQLVNKDWSFSNFTYSTDGFTFSVTASTRIPAQENDRLAERAAQLGTRGKITITLTDADPSIPLHQKREAESNLRVSLIEKAKTEAEKLGGKVDAIAFSRANSQALRGAMMASSYSLSNDATGGGLEGVSLGHSEKMALTASIAVIVGGEKVPLNG
jgi:hypothetical protein